MYLHVYITKDYDMYELKVNKVSKNRMRYDNEHIISLDDIVYKNGKFSIAKRVNIKFKAILPEDKDKAKEYVLEMIKHITDGIDETEEMEQFDEITEAIDYIKELKESNGVNEEYVSLKDVIINDSVMNKIEQTLKFLNKDEKYRAIGAKTPKNLLLYGPAGTGKTLIAKALGCESGRKVYTASAAEFAEKYVGVGPRRIRDLFNAARDNRPSIVFIDEIDCIAMKRTGDRNGEDIKMLNQLLTELDGIADNKDITVICTTNRLDMLDPAFIRAGRFDRKIKIEKPNYENRIKMFELYLSKVKHDNKIDLNILADITSGCNGADIQTIVNESAILAADKELSKVSMDELTEKAEEIMQSNRDSNLEVNAIGF